MFGSFLAVFYISELQYVPQSKNYMHDSVFAESKSQQEAIVCLQLSDTILCVMSHSKPHKQDIGANKV